MDTRHTPFTLYSLVTTLTSYIIPENVINIQPAAEMQQQSSADRSVSQVAKKKKIIKKSFLIIIIILFL